MAHSKPTVTIDLAEYQELLTFKDIKVNPIECRIYQDDLEDKKNCTINMKERSNTFDLGKMTFRDTKTAEVFLKNFEFKIVRQP